MYVVGYCRTSTADQVAGYEAQQRDLGQAGCQKIFGEQVSSVAHRAQLEAALGYVREGDVLCVTKMDRLCRSTADLLAIIGRLDAKGVSLRILDFGGGVVCTQSPTGKLMLTLLGAFAQHEREIIRERTREGIERAKALGRYKGRQPTARRKLPAIKELAEHGMKASEIARELNISRASVYRLLAGEA